MTLFAKKALGLEICGDGARIALVAGKKEKPVLAASGFATFPDETVRLSLREPNVQNPDAFVATLRELYLKLLTRVSRVSVSLPDAIGRVLLLDVETRFKSRQEGADIVRWKLKKNFPFDINEAHLDYQVVQERETGAVSLLVSLISKSIVRQYEDLLVEAGMEPTMIDFTTFNLYRLFAQRLGLADNSLVVTCHGGSVGVLIFYDGKLAFCRTKDLSATTFEPNRLFREVNSSFLVYQEKYPVQSPTEAFCICSDDDAEAFRALVGEATGLDPVSLDVERMVVGGKGADVGQETLRMLSAALGAATRNL